jgi:hypothetical protein
VGARERRGLDGKGREGKGREGKEEFGPKLTPGSAYGKLEASYQKEHEYHQVHSMNLYGRFIKNEKILVVSLATKPIPTL